MGRKTNKILISTEWGEKWVSIMRHIPSQVPSYLEQVDFTIERENYIVAKEPQCGMKIPGEAK